MPINSTQTVHNTVHCVEFVACTATRMLCSLCLLYRESCTWSHTLSHAQGALSPPASTASTALTLGHVVTQNLYRDTRLNKLCRDREFSVATKNFEHSVTTEKPLSRKKNLCRYKKTSVVTKNCGKSVARAHSLLSCSLLHALCACSALGRARWCAPVARSCCDKIYVSSQKAF